MKSSEAPSPQTLHKPLNKTERYGMASKVTAVFISAALGVASCSGERPTSARAIDSTAPAISATSLSDSTPSPTPVPNDPECSHSQEVTMDSETGVAYTTTLSNVTDADGMNAWSFAGITQSGGQEILLARQGSSITLSNKLTTTDGPTSLRVDLFAAKESPGFTPPPGSETANGFAIPQGKHPQNYISGLVACGDTFTIDMSNGSLSVQENSPIPGAGN